MEDIPMQDPQDQIQQQPIVPKVRKGFEKLYKNQQCEIYQFLDGKDLLKLERTNKWTSQAARQDFLWRYLVQNSLQITNMKYKGDTWKTHFWRNYGSKVFMTPEKFNYVMCPIRHFKELVKIVDCFENFVFAADEKGNFTIFLINEDDMENDDDTLTSQSFIHGSGIEYLRHQLRDEVSEVILVNGQGEVYTYELQNPAAGIFEVTNVTSVQLPFEKLPQNLYVCPLNDKGTLLYVSNYPLDGYDFMCDTSIFIFDTIQKKIIYGNKLMIELAPSNQYLQEAVNGMSRNDAQIAPHIRAWLLAQPNRQVDQNVTLQTVKADKNKQRLAVYDGSKLTISLFNKTLAVVNTNMTKMEIFFNKTNTILFQDESQVDLPLAMELRLHKGILIANHLTCIKMFDYKTFQVTDSHDLQVSLSPISFLALSSFTDEFCLIRKLPTQIEVTQCKIDVANKKFTKPMKIAQEEEKHRIQDIDIQRNMVISANSEGGVNIRRVGQDFGKPYFINCGSKAIKTYKAHPTKPGVSLVKTTQSKVVVVLGNLIRVYSFDFKTK